MRTLVASLIVSAVVYSTNASAVEFKITSLQQRIFETIQSSMPAVVSVRQRGGMFSGVIVSKDGKILSAGHAVTPGATYQVFLPDGRQLQARGKGSNPQADCALLQITSDVKDLPYVRMGDSDTLVKNQPCLSIAFPGGQGSRGVPVIRFGRLMQGGANARMIQSTALMEPGDSGGPLFDLQGRVIGIHSRIGRSMARNFEVPVNIYKEFWNELNEENSFTEAGPPTPKLGFVGENEEDGLGVIIKEIVKDSLAQKHGLKPDDIIQSVQGQATKTITDLRKVLVSARDDRSEEITVKVLRGDKQGEDGLEIKIPFDVKRKGAESVPLPVYAEQDYKAPSAIEQLADLPAVFADMEDELDDACCIIESTLTDGGKIKIVGTRIKDSDIIVSKSSMVHGTPEVMISEELVVLEVISRIAEDDLVVMKAPLVNTSGVDLTSLVSEDLDMGSFLMTPESEGDGLISIVSSKAFSSPKQQSRGYLGVVPVDAQNSGGAVLQEVTEDGAAKRAGLMAGDVITKMNETSIKTQMELRRFLGTLDPDATVEATIKRKDEELVKIIRLGSFPNMSNHAADRMDKSGRRDGFPTVIPHDADLTPENCGGPLFDLEGKFVGLNIARNSRVRSYAIPASRVKELITNKD